MGKAMAGVVNHSSGVILSVFVFAQLIAISVIALVLVWVLHFREGVSLTSVIKAKIFNVHPLLMVTFILLAGEAILVQKTSLLGTTRTTVQKTIHTALHLSALVTGILGVYAVFKFHQDLQIPHIYTLHSWLGISTICLFTLQWLFSFFAFGYPKLKSSTRAHLAPFHVFSGMFIFLLGITTAMIGLGEKFIYAQLKRGQEALLVNFTGVLLILFAFAVAAKVTLSRAY